MLPLLKLVRKKLLSGSALEVSVTTVRDLRGQKRKSVKYNASEKLCVRVQHERTLSDMLR